MRQAGLWMPMYWSDYFGDTMHLTTEEHGAYLLLLGAYWINSGPLPADDAYLRRVTRSAKRWCRIRETVLALFEIEPVSEAQNGSSENENLRASENSKTGFQIRHKRVDYELLRSSERHNSAKANGRAGGLAKSKLVTVTVTEDKNLTPLPSGDPPLAVAVNGSGHAPAKRSNQGTRLDPEWEPGAEGIAYAREHGFDGDTLNRMFGDFQDHFLAAAGAKGRKASWPRTWKRWVRTEHERVREKERRDEFWRERYARK